MTTRFGRILPLVLTLLICLACQVTKKAGEPPPTATPGSRLPVMSSAPTVTREATATPAARGPEATTTAYLEALQQRRFEQAVAFISDYSLSLLGLSRQDVLSHFEQQDFEGWQLLDYRVTESQELDEDLVLVHTLVREQSGRDEPQTYNVWRALRREHGEWRINWNLVIDDRLLDVEPQTINGLTVQPLRIIRYTDGMRLLFRIENNSSRGYIWGWAVEEVALFHFGEQIVSVSGVYETIAPERAYPEAHTTIEGFYSTYPDAIDLAGWVQASEEHPRVPVPFATPWTYHFELSYSQTAE